MIACIQPETDTEPDEPGPAPGPATARLALRPLEMADAGWIARGASNPKVARMTASISHPYPPLAAELFILSMHSAEALRGDRVRAVTRRIDGVPLGLMGLHPRADGAWELGYWLDEAHWGRGYATEAGTALLAEADALGLGPVVAGHYADNPASGRVLEKLGFAYTGEVEDAFSMGRMASAPCRRMARG
jgi:RimJ/RimL family protein N-acetyltransferase